LGSLGGGVWGVRVGGGSRFFYTTLPPAKKPGEGTLLGPRNKWLCLPVVPVPHQRLPMTAFRQRSGGHLCNITAVQKALAMYSVPVIAAALMYTTIAGARVWETTHCRQMLCRRRRRSGVASTGIQHLGTLSEAVDDLDGGGGSSTDDDAAEEVTSYRGDEEERPSRSGGPSSHAEAEPHNDGVTDPSRCDLGRGATAPASNTGRRPRASSCQVAPAECEAAPTPTSTAPSSGPPGDHLSCTHVPAVAAGQDSPDSGRVARWVDPGDGLEKDRVPSTSRRASSVGAPAAGEGGTWPVSWAPGSEGPHTNLGYPQKVTSAVAPPDPQAVVSTTKQHVPFEGKPAPAVGVSSLDAVNRMGLGLDPEEQRMLVYMAAAAQSTGSGPSICRADPGKSNGRRPSEVVPAELDPEAEPSRWASQAASSAIISSAVLRADGAQGGRLSSRLEKAQHHRRRSSTGSTVADSGGTCSRVLSQSTIAWTLGRSESATTMPVLALTTGASQPKPHAPPSVPNLPNLKLPLPSSVTSAPPSAPQAAPQAPSPQVGVGRKAPHAAHSRRSSFTVQTGSVRALVYAASTRMALFAYSSLVFTTLKLLRWVSESMLNSQLTFHHCTLAS
jgi:hypothetical protein